MVAKAKEDKASEKPVQKPTKKKPAEKMSADIMPAEKKSIEKKPEERPAKDAGSVPRLKLKYEGEVVPKLKEQFGYTTPMQVPKLEKVVLNMGIGEAVANPKLLDAAARDLGIIAGQKPVITRAKRSISNFKLRTGMPIGCMVTLRGERMYEFIDKLFNIALPRVRDFRGSSPKSFDGRGNYSLGIKEQLIFPEIDYDKVEKIQGLDIVIVTTARTDEEAFHLLRLLGLPFREAA